MSWLRTIAATGMFTALAIFMMSPGQAHAAASHNQQPDPTFKAEAAWQEFVQTFEMFYAYSERDDFDVQALLDKTQSLALAQTTPQAFRQTLQQMAIAFTDPHFLVGPLTDTDFNVIPTSSDLIIEQSPKSGEYLIKDVRADSPAFDAGIRPGWVLLAIDSQPVDEIVQTLYAPFFDPPITAPTAKQRAYAATLAANGRRTGRRHLVLQAHGQDRHINLANPREFSRQLSRKPLLTIFRQDNIAIIRIHNSLGDNALITAFDQAMADIQDADYLILDLRETPSGGNTEVARSLIGHFLKAMQPYQVHEVPSLEREFSVPRHFVEYAKPRKPYFDPAKTLALGGHWTGSMGEGVIIGLDGAADMTIIASNMGDLLGGLSNFDLKQSSIRLDIGTETLFHVNGTPREDFIADITLPASDVNVAGEDPALHAALTYFSTLKP